MKNLWKVKEKFTGDITTVIERVSCAAGISYKIFENNVLVEIPEDDFLSRFEFIDEVNLLDEVKDYIDNYVEEDAYLREYFRMIKRRLYPEYFKKGVLVHFNKPYTRGDSGSYYEMYSSRNQYIVVSVVDVDQFTTCVRIAKYRGPEVDLDKYSIEYDIPFYKDRVELNDAFNYLSRYDLEF